MNITLIGMAGVGKSYIGRKLAERLNYKFIDVDEIIEEKTKQKLQQIIDSQGEEKFLKIEEEAVLDIGIVENHIISPGGSVIYSEKAMKFLKNNSTVIFLNDSLENIQKRISDKDKRGLVGLKSSSFEELFEKRLELYDKYADIVINIDNSDAEKIVEEIVQNLELFS